MFSMFKASAKPYICFYTVAEGSVAFSGIANVTNTFPFLLEGLK